MLISSQSVDCYLCVYGDCFLVLPSVECFIIMRCIIGSHKCRLYLSSLFCEVLILCSISLFNIICIYRSYAAYNNWSQSLIDCLFGACKLIDYHFVFYIKAINIRFWIIHSFCGKNFLSFYFIKKLFVFWKYGIIGITLMMLHFVFCLLRFIVLFKHLIFHFIM